MSYLYPIDKHLPEYPNDEELKTKENELKRIVLQAAANGYVDTLRKAIPVLYKIQERLHDTRPGLNFSEGRESDHKPVYNFTCFYGRLLCLFTFNRSTLLCYMHVKLDI